MTRGLKLLTAVTSIFLLTSCFADKNDDVFTHYKGDSAWAEYYKEQRGEKNTIDAPSINMSNPKLAGVTSSVSQASKQIGQNIAEPFTSYGRYIDSSNENLIKSDPIINRSEYEINGREIVSVKVLGGSGRHFENYNQSNYKSQNNVPLTTLNKMPQNKALEKLSYNIPEVPREYFSAAGSICKKQALIPSERQLLDKPTRVITCRYQGGEMQNFIDFTMR